MSRLKFLKRICSFFLVLVMLFVCLDSGTVLATRTENGGGGGGGSAVEGWGVVDIFAYKVTFVIEKFELDDSKLKEQFMGKGGVAKFRTFWYNVVNGVGTQLAHTGMLEGQLEFDAVMEQTSPANTIFVFAKNDKTSDGASLDRQSIRNEFQNGGSRALNLVGSSSVPLDARDFSGDDYKIVELGQFTSEVWGGGINNINDLLNTSTDATNGLNAFNDPDRKRDAYIELCKLAGISLPYDVDEFDKKGVIIVQKCTMIRLPYLPSADGYGHGVKDRAWYAITYHDLCKGMGVCSSYLPITINGKSIQLGSTSGSHVRDSGAFYMDNYAPLIPHGYLKPFNASPEPYQLVAGYGIWGLCTSAAAGTATNTLAVYNADPVTGGTADPTKWEIYSTIVDGKMPDTPDGTCEDLKFWNKTDWKSASKFLEAIDGGVSDTLQNIDNGEYAMIARDSYRNVAVPAYKSVLMSGVVANNDKAQDAAKLLEKAPENVVWGAKTVSELTGNADSFGNVITIATLNGMPFGNNTSGYAQTANGLQMVGGVRKAGTLTNDPILEQVNSEIKNAFTQSSSGNWTGTGVGTHFTTDTSALGSAVEIVVKGKPVESDLHVISVFDKVATLTPNVKNYKYTTVNYGIVDPQLDSGVSDPVQAVILVPKDGTPTGDTITSSMQGTTPDNAVSTFTGLSPDSREGAPIINVGNEDDKGYDIEL